MLLASALHAASCVGQPEKRARCSLLLLSVQAEAPSTPPTRACTKIRTRYYSSVSTCIYFSMCGCQMASPSAMQPVPMTKRICCGRNKVRNGTAKPAMKLPITECAVSSAALHR